MPNFREGEMMRINVFLIERREIMQMGLKTMLNDHKNIKLVGGAFNMDISSLKQNVLRSISVGLTNNQKAEKLFTGVKTIKMSRKQLFNETGTSNIATFVNFVFMNRLTN